MLDGGYAGICVPEEYGGRGLSPAHQAVFNREIRGYDLPAEIRASTFIPCMALLLEFGTEETISGGSPYVTGSGNRPHEGPSDAANMVDVARRIGVLDNRHTRELIGEARAFTGPLSRGARGSWCP